MTRRALIIVFLVLALGYVNYQAVATEREIADGRSVLLPLAPRDPRSLMQGDFMRLRYEIDDSFQIYDAPPNERGQMIVELDQNEVGRFLRLADGENSAELPPNQLLISYRSLGYGAIEFAPTSYFFQEGTAELYEPAQYADVRITEDGRVFLIGLRDEQFRLLGE